MDLGLINDSIRESGYPRQLNGILDEFQINATLGQGGSATVYQARWLGIVVTIFSALSIFLLIVSFTGDKFGSLSLHIGGYLGILGVVCAFGAGLLYSVKPEPKRAMR
ncbi:MAG: hypothetical protein JRJ87_15655 [Deltaproteobacteria bacterium]|nr:hypothetical protein [Deltaproteobacteria bacterium]